MRANLPQLEPEVLKFWEEIDIYRLVQEANTGKKKFILHDGPPYANGDIHLGHTLNKVLKDIIIKFHTMTGYDSPYVPGWDTHGLPIEQQAIKALGLNRHNISVVDFRRQCRDYALKFVDIQRQQFKRLGVRGDWENAYLTLAPHYEAVQIGVFGEMAKKGYIYKGLKPVYWCADCETALAEAEIEYSDKESPSIYVKFAVADARGLFPEQGAFFVIWTTTPWTLPANVAIAVHPDFTYDLIEVNGERLVAARELAEGLLARTGGTGRVVATFKGQDLDRIVCRHPFMDRDSLVILGNHVTLEQGTGCVHTAPGHGEEDFLVARDYDLPVISPLDDKGRFTQEGGKFAGIFCQDANQAIIEELQNRGALIATERIQHQYPHCWRCKRPIVYRATEQWFASIDGFRQETLEAIEKVNWIPAGVIQQFPELHQPDSFNSSRQLLHLMTDLVKPRFIFLPHRNSSPGNLPQKDVFHSRGKPGSRSPSIKKSARQPRGSRTDSNHSFSQRALITSAQRSQMVGCSLSRPTVGLYIQQRSHFSPEA
jgi:isoleucyl-tRNA synthetase